MVYSVEKLGVKYWELEIEVWGIELGVDRYIFFNIKVLLVCGRSIDEMFVVKVMFFDDMLCLMVDDCMDILVLVVENL